MVFPVIYAVTTWYLVAHWRRRWRGLAALAVAFGLLVALFLATRRVHELDGIAHPMLSFQVLLIPYMFLVGGVGSFIWLMPRPPLPAYHCTGCAYDLRGLDAREGEATLCPECGKPIPVPPPPEQLIPIPRKPPPGGKKPTL